MGFPSLIHTGASLLVKVKPDQGTEKIIGFATNLTYTVTQGQKSIFVVDSPFPAEIAQSAAPSFVKGSLTLYMPKGSTMESAGLVPYRTSQDGQNSAAKSKYLDLSIYDRLTNQAVMTCKFCKVGQYTVNIPARGIVSITLSFDGMILEPGYAL
jgi:hypothetical protein